MAGFFWKIAKIYDYAKAYINSYFKYFHTCI